MFRKSRLKPLMIAAFVAGTLNLHANIPDGFSLVWSDEFDYTGAPDPAKWGYDLGGGGWGNNERQTYTDSLENARVEDGRLIIEVHQDLGGRSPAYTSARLTTREKGQWKYGRFEIRAKTPRETGTWSAVWMLAADTLHSTSLWPENGEIDIMEAVGYEADPLFKDIVEDPQLNNIHGTVHTEKRNGRDNEGIGGSRFLETAYDQFHTYAINWYDDRIEWEVDGEIYFTFLKSTVVSTRNPPPDFSDAWPFDQRFYLILNVAMGGDWGGVFNTGFFPSSPYGTSGINHDGDWPQRMEIDYVRVYQPASTPEPSEVPGTIIASEMDASEGILVQTAQNNESPHNLSEIDAGDYGAFALNVPGAGTYTVTASVAATTNDALLSWETSEAGSGASDIPVPNTGDWQTWQTIELGTVNLPAGENQIRIDTSTGKFNLAWIRLEGEAADTWKGYSVDASGNVNTDSWLGWINVVDSPWLFSYSLNNWLYSPVALEPIFNTDSQWIYVLKPQ